MKGFSGPVHDARTLLGMHTRPAWLIAGCYLISEAALSLSSTHGIHHVWPVLVALALTAAAAAALLGIRSDPLPVAATAGIALTIPAAAALTVFNLPVPPLSIGQTWAFGAGTATATFLCVRGRALAAWAGLLSAIAVSALWSASAGRGGGLGLGLSVINLGPLLMATFFAYALRPAAHAIFALREQSNRRAAAEATAAAVLDERHDQIRQLDDMVRPLLERIAGPAPIDAATADDCRLTEASLRDILRAPELATEPVTTAVRAARRRGVDIVLIDDRGLSEIDPAVRLRVLATIAAELDRTDGGSAHIRILPPDRPVLATVVVNHPESGSRRIELDAAANPLAHP